MRGNWTRRPLEIDDVVLSLPIIGASKLVHESVLTSTPWDDQRSWLVLKVYNRSRPENIEKGECVLTFTIINQLSAT